MSNPIDQSPARQKNTEHQAIAASCGGLSMIIHAAADFILTGGQQSDIKSLDELLPLIGPCKRQIADRAYNADALLTKLNGNDTKPVITGKIIANSLCGMINVSISNAEALRTCLSYQGLSKGSYSLRHTRANISRCRCNVIASVVAARDARHFDPISE